MLLALAALALQPSTLAPNSPTPDREAAYVFVTMTDYRGGDTTIQLIPVVRTAADEAKVLLLMARREERFMGKTTGEAWADGRTCPAVAASLAALRELRPLADFDAARDAARPLIAPPPHGASVTVKADGMQMTGRAGSPVGLWTQSLLEGLGRCWQPKKPVW